MKDAWLWNQGSEVTDPLLEIKEYELKALSSIQINLGSISNYLASIHHMSIYDMSSDRYRLYIMECSRQNINSLVSNVRKLGNHLSLEIDISNIASDVLMTGMTITPTAGTYLVLASCTSNNSGNNTNFISVYSGGVQVSGTQQAIVRTHNNLANFKIQYVSNCQVTVNGSQAIDIRWRVSAGTGTCYSRYLTIIKVG